MIISVYDFLCDLRFSGAFVWFPYEICRGSFGPHLQRRVQNYHPDSFKFDHLTCKQRNIMEAVDGAPFWPAPFLSHAKQKKNGKSCVPKTHRNATVGFVSS